MKVAKLYAQVWYDVVNGTGPAVNLDKYRSELESFGDLFRESELLVKVFNSPNVSDLEKESVLTVFSQKLGLSPLSSRFLMMLVKKNRIKFLGTILKEIETIQVDRSGGLSGELISAVPLSLETQEKVTHALSKKLNKKVTLKIRVDSSLIAGIRVTVAGITYDSSIQNKLEKLVNYFH